MPAHDLSADTQEHDTWLHVCGLKIALEAGDRIFRPGIDEMQLHFGGRAPDRMLPPAISLRAEVSRASVEVPKEAHRVAALHSNMTLWKSGETYYAGSRHAIVSIDFGRMAGRLVVSDLLRAEPKRLTQTQFTLWTTALLILLRRFDLFALHCAALVSPDGSGLLLSADRMSGKSTLAGALIRSGWSFINDDLVLVNPTPENVSVRRLRRYFSLDPAVARSWLPRTAVRTSRLVDWKVVVSMEDAHPDQCLDSCMPKCIMFPQIVAHDLSSVRPLPPFAAVHRLIDQSSLLLIDDSKTQTHLETLTRLTRQCTTHTFEGGRDVLEEPERVASLLRVLAD